LPHLLEHKFELTFPEEDIILSGVIDRVDRCRRRGGGGGGGKEEEEEEEEEEWLIEYKSRLKKGKSSLVNESHELQLGVYGLAWEHLMTSGDNSSSSGGGGGGSRRRLKRLVIESLEDGREGVVEGEERVQEVVEKARRMVIEVAGRIRSGEEDNHATPSYLNCSFCSYRTMCPQSVSNK